MTATEGAYKRSRFLKRLMQDQSGNTLAMAAAAVLPITAIVGGAVDVGRGYMTKARLQQACDAGALAARKSMTTNVFQTADMQVGERYFDFNFPEGTYGTVGRVRSYVQPRTNATPPVPLPRIDGTASVNVPTTLMRVFGQTNMTISVDCQSLQDVTHADVAMVLDITHSMTEPGNDMRVSSTGTATETRLSALQRSVKAFYDALGPGRAAGDATKGRIRYAIVPYGTVVNAGYLLRNDQMVDSWDYSTPTANSSTVYTYALSTGYTTSYGPYSPATRPATVSDATLLSTANYPTWNALSSSSSSVTFTNHLGASVTLDRVISQDENNCYKQNTATAGTSNTAPGIRSVGVSYFTGDSETRTDKSFPAPVHPQATVNSASHSATRSVTPAAFRYRWFRVSGTNACRLEWAWGNSNTQWTQTRTSPNSTQSVTWTTHAPNTLVMPSASARTINVASLKAGGSSWNNSLTVTNASRPTAGAWYRLSGQSSYTALWPGTIGNVTLTWRGCVEERTIDNTITTATPLDPLSTNSWDLDVTRPAVATNNNSRWRPFLPEIFMATDGLYVGSSTCPPPALKLQEIASYNRTTLTTTYPNLFDNTSGGTDSSYYYPYTSTAITQDNTATPTIDEYYDPNAATLKAYIDRITTVDGTIHDSGFIWGMHLVSGQGMFASENPDFIDGLIVGRNIVFMTDGDINGGEERYVYSGHNWRDGRLTAATATSAQVDAVHNRRLRILCEQAKLQGITVWVVVINNGTPLTNVSDLQACASGSSYYKSATTGDELVASFTTIAQSIGGLRLTQ
jgi:Flp pilus assembly protein TadG